MEPVAITAVCLSTVDQHGLPDARFVDLNAASATGFIFCTHLDSGKGLALDANPYAALTFWWDHLERQVRVVGHVERIADALADTFWHERLREAQLTTWASQQSAVLDARATLEARYAALQAQFDGGPIPRSERWGGYCIVPTRIEFLTFNAARMHERLLFSRDGSGWRQDWLQP